jgi:hypothetical protein
MHYSGRTDGCIEPFDEPLWGLVGLPDDHAAAEGRPWGCFEGVPGSLGGSTRGWSGKDGHQFVATKSSLHGSCSSRCPERGGGLGEQAVAGKKPGVFVHFFEPDKINAEDGNRHYGGGGDCPQQILKGRSWLETGNKIDRRGDLLTVIRSGHSGGTS